MAKKSKLATPKWILEGYDSPEDYEKAQGKKETPKSSGKKVFSVRKCPECKSDKVSVVIGEVGLWECKDCNWKGEEVKKEELTEEEFMEYLDSKGEDVA